MLTPEEKKIFKTFSFVVRSIAMKSGQPKRYLVFSSPDWDDVYPTLTPSEDMSIYGSIDLTKIPNSVFSALDSWLNREVAPKWEESFDALDESMSNYSVSQYNFEIQIDFGTGEIFAKAMGEYLVDDDEELHAFSVRDNAEFRNIVAEYKKNRPNVETVSFEFDGGADDSYYPDDVQTNLGPMSLTRELQRFVDSLLTPGWENNEGGHGTVEINFKDGTFEMNFSDFYQELMYNTIAEDNFLTNE